MPSKQVTFAFVFVYVFVFVFEFLLYLFLRQLWKNYARKTGDFCICICICVCICICICGSFGRIMPSSRSKLLCRAASNTEI